MSQRERVTFASEPVLEGNTIKGLAHAFGTVARVEKGRYEQFAAGSFDEALKTADVRALIEHERRLIIGRQSAGTLRLAAEPEGLRYEIDLPDTTYANDLRESLSRGDITEMSFSILPGKFEMRRHTDGSPLRLHTQVAEFYDVSPVTIPAFEGTSANLFAHRDGESAKSQMALARARALTAAKAAR